MSFTLSRVQTPAVEAKVSNIWTEPILSSCKGVREELLGVWINFFVCNLVGI